MLSEQENNIIELIYEAALKPNNWNKVLRKIIQFTNSSTAIFTYFDQLRPEQNFIYTLDIPIDGLRNYELKNLNVVDMRIHGELMNTYGLEHAYQIDCRSYSEADNDDLKRFYQYCLEPANICYLNGVLLEYGKYKWGVIAVHRSSESTAYKDTELKCLERLAKHLRRAIQIRRQIQSLEHERSTYSEILDKFNVGVVIVNSVNKVSFVNKYAKQSLCETDLIEIDFNNRFQTIEPFNTELKRLIQNTLRNQNLDQFHLSESHQIGGTMQIRRNSDQTAYIVTVSPLCFVEEKFKTDQNLVAIFFNKLKDRKLLSEALLRETFQLTPREIGICQLFMDEQNLEKIANHCGITLNTLRTYLKTIYMKLGCNTQAEMIRTLVEFIEGFQHIE